MTLQEFIDKWLGKQLEVAGSNSAKYQCVDLANGYIRDVLGLSIIEWTNAKDFPERMNTDEFVFIENTPYGVPQNGDIIVWNGRVGGGYGHIAVFIEGNVSSFKSFDQNWSEPLYCTIENHSYSNVRGWMRAKNQQPEDPEGQVITTVSQITWDILTGMKGDTSKDEHDAWKEKYENPMQMTHEISANDETYRKSIAQPYLEEQSKAHLSEIARLENTVNTERVENNKYWQTKLDTANRNYLKLEENYRNLLKNSIKSVSFMQFLRIKLFGGDDNAK